MQIRLKLTELPAIHQTRRSAATFANALELLSEYLPYLLALKQFQRLESHRLDRQSDAVTAFPPLFCGFDLIDLSSDRLVGRAQRAEFTVAVDIVLSLFAMAQLTALYAEAQVEHAACVQNAGLLQIGEAAWQDARRLFERSTAFAEHARNEFVGSEEAQRGAVLRFFSSVATRARVLGHSCAIHGISSRVCLVRNLGLRWLATRSQCVGDTAS